MEYIEFENVSKTFGIQPVLNEIRLSIKKGELVSLLGPSGCGKSTLLRCLAGLECPTSGEIYLDGINVTKKLPKDRGIGMVFQQYSLFPNMTVEQNVGFGLKMMGISRKHRQDKVNTMLEIVDLKGSEDKKPHQLSGGMQQRAALARALVTEPKVLLLDEPLSAIDAKLRKSLQAEIRKIQKNLGITTIFVTHDQSEAMVMSDKLCLMNNGLIEQSGTPSDIYISPKSKFAAAFIGNYNIITGEEFYRISGIRSFDGSVAIRPEVISIEKVNSFDEDTNIIAEGVVVDFTLRGNTLSYSVLCRDVALNIDVLYRSFHLLNLGDKVYLAFEMRNCVPV